MVVGSANPVRAIAQHAALLRTVRSLGAHVTMIPFVHGAFDSVFAKDNAIYGREAGITHALLATPRYEVRRREQGARARDLTRINVAVHARPAPFEGGDVIVVEGCCVLLGHGFRSSRDAGPVLSELFGLPVVPLELAESSLYHLDTALAVLADGTALVCSDAFTPSAWRALRALPLREIIEVSRDEATRFALNVVEIDDAIVTGADSDELRHALEARGRRVIYTPLDEFQRSGGSAACLLAPVYE
nr:amidinotransferase [Deltaproteobacteria bacterium]